MSNSAVSEYTNMDIWKMMMSLPSGTDVSVGGMLTGDRKWDERSKVFLCE